jgi:Uma2 family endonuclease
MGMPASVNRWTRDQVLALPDDGKRYELVDGELLVSPSPRPLHQIALAELLRLLDPYIRIHRLGTMLFSPADLDLRSGQLVQPDLFVGKLIDGRAPREWDEFGIPILVVEILSPSTARFDRITKRRLYQRAGVGTYWIVDLDARLVEVWTPASDHPAIADGDLHWQPDPALGSLVLELPEFFREVFGEGAGN